MDRAPLPAPFRIASGTTDQALSGTFPQTASPAILGTMDGTTVYVAHRIPYGTKDQGLPQTASEATLPTKDEMTLRTTRQTTSGTMDQGLSRTTSETA